jgi:hypothetical protein
MVSAGSFPALIRAAMTSNEAVARRSGAGSQWVDVVAAEREPARLVIGRGHDERVPVAGGPGERDSDGPVVGEDVAEEGGRVVPVGRVVDPAALDHEEEAALAGLRRQQAERLLGHLGQGRLVRPVPVDLVGEVARGEESGGRERVEGVVPGPVEGDGPSVGGHRLRQRRGVGRAHEEPGPAAEEEVDAGGRHLPGDLGLPARSPTWAANAAGVASVIRLVATSPVAMPRASAASRTVRHGAPSCRRRSPLCTS